MHRNGPDMTTWALPEGAIARLGRGNIGHNMAFSPDGTSLVVPTAIGCWWYDLTTLQPVALWETEKGVVLAISFSANGQWIATGNWSGIVKVWDAQTLQCLAEIDVPEHPIGKGKSIRFLTFSPDGQHLAVSGSHRTAVYAWHRNLNTPIAWFPVDPTSESLGRLFFHCHFLPTAIYWHTSRTFM